MAPGTKIELLTPSRYRGWRATVVAGPYEWENHLGVDVPHVDAAFDLPLPECDRPPKADVISLEIGEFRVVSAIDLLGELT